jgi:hypothetical protein
LKSEQRKGGETKMSSFKGREASSRRGAAAASSRASSNSAASSSSSMAGKLIFDSSFESGNLSDVDEVVKEAEYDIKIRPDTNNPRYRVWFYFSVRNARKKQVKPDPNP